jgi:hypothetical protein
MEDVMVAPRDGSSAETESASRRRVLGAALAAGVGALLGARRGAPEAAAKHKRKKARCAGCPRTCSLVFTQAGGGNICGNAANSASNSCVPSTSSSQCLAIDANFPQCITSGEILHTGEKTSLACETSPGQCRAVLACVT